MEYLQYALGGDIEKALKRVLNLVINGIPSILTETNRGFGDWNFVLNLVINGIPSIP